MKKSIIAITVIALTTGILASAAQADTPWVDKRQHRQGVRIHDGVKDGSLRPRETAVLLRGQARVYRAERRFKADGVVTRGERYRLHRRQNRQNRRIYRFKHN